MKLKTEMSCTSCLMFDLISDQRIGFLKETADRSLFFTRGFQDGKKPERFTIKGFQALDCTKKANLVFLCIT